MLADELENLLDVLLEALFQHLICLVKASYLQVGELDGTPFEQVNEPSGGGHDDVASVSYLSHLFLDVTSSIHCYDFEISADS